MTNTKNKVKFLAYTAVSAALIAVCAWISIPFGGVPITLQIFGVVLVTMLNGGLCGIISVALYLAVGMIGLPVFSSFNGGIAVIAGPTGGYLWGFLLIPLIYFMFEKLKWIFCDKVTVTNLLPVLLGLVACYATGTVQFALVASSSQNSIIHILTLCVFPYILPDATKIALAFVCTRRLKKANLF